MNLRTPGDDPAARQARLSGFRLFVPCAVIAVLLLAVFAGSSGAGVTNYQGTLYFAGGASSMGGSFQLTTAVPSAQGAAPVAAAGAPNSGGVPTASYKYIYVTTSGAARTASVASNQVAVTNAPVTVTNVPVGADVYRARATSPTTQFFLVGSNAGPTTTYVDTSTASSGALLPQADNRVNLALTGWAPFVPGTTVQPIGNTAVTGSTPSIPSSCAGWVVDAVGGMSFAAGLWRFNTQVKPDANGNGAAVLTVAMWKVDDSGNTVGGGTVVPPTDGGSFTFNNVSQTVSVSYTTSSATTLASNEHLCVQFWRHQTTAYSSGGATSRTIQMLAWDPNNTISIHPAPNGFAYASLSSPADNTYTQTTPTLGATYTDAEGDAGTITIRLCSDSGCGNVLQSSGALAATNGSTQTWTPTGPLADGTYYWQAQSKDGLGLASSWTAPRTFVVDNAAPTTNITASPPALSNASGGSFSFTASEPVTGFQCNVDGGTFAGCSSPYAYSGLADGSHTFQVKATADLAGNGGSTTSYAWTIDTAPPNTSLTSTPPALSNSANPSLSISATEPGSSFECSLDGSGFGACASPKSYSGLADGSHTFQARAIDPAGNPDPTPVSHTWTIDATAPDTSIGPTRPAALTTFTSASFDLSANEAGSTFECSRDGGSFTACTSPKSYSGLVDGTHTFQVRATDTAGNTDGSPASYTWVVDTTPPDTTIGPTKPATGSPSPSATFDIASTEPGSTFACRLDGGAYGACTSPVSYSGLADGSHRFDVKATDAAGNTDASAASSTWQVDTSVPATPTLSSPADALLTNTTPQVAATFADSTPGDTGTLDFRICSASAAAGAACAPLVSSVSSASVANGGTATATPAALPDGTYHWQARAQDAVGNQSGWSATRSFQIDSSTPTVPALVEPVDGAWLRDATLRAGFSKPAFAGTGTVEFRVCSDGGCLATASSGTSATVTNGSTAGWALPDRLGDGMYWWQARSKDAAGNQSAWSAARMFHLDKSPPLTPKNFHGSVAEDGLTLRWEPQSDPSVSNFFIYVDGVSGVSLGATTYEYKAGAFDVADGRSFAVVAVDGAGNQSPLSKALVGVPSLVGLTFDQAQAAAKARGFVVHRPAPSGGVVISQTPAAPTVAEKGSDVIVVLSDETAPTALTLSATPGRVVCGAGAVVRLQLFLSDGASVRARLLSGRRTVTNSLLGRLKAGTSVVRVKLPRHLARGTYKLALNATAGSRTASATVKVARGGGRSCRAR